MTSGISAYGHPVCMNCSKVIICCFSGTGNTLYASREMAKIFQKAGKKCSLKIIPAPFPHPEKDTLYIFAFPVYEQSVPAIVYEWFADLPVSSFKLPAAVLTTMAGMSGLVKTPVKKLLTEKNFAPLAVREIIFPSNFIYSASDEKNRKIMKRALGESAKFAETILNGSAGWPRRSLLAGILFPFSRIMSKCFSWTFSHYHTSPDCTRCGLCAEICPENNITVNDNGVKWGRKCTVCLRCVNFCPHNAVRSSICNFLYRMHYTAGKDVLKEFRKTHD